MPLKECTKFSSGINATGAKNALFQRTKAGPLLKNSASHSWKQAQNQTSTLKKPFSLLLGNPFLVMVETYTRDIKKKLIDSASAIPNQPNVNLDSKAQTRSGCCS